MKITRMIVLALLANLCWIAVSYGQTDADREAVEQAIRNYVDALYEVQPELVDAGVHPELAKRGFWRPAEEKEYKDMSPMTFQQLKDLSARWNAKGWLSEDAPKEIVIFEVQDQTASGKLTAEWGTDYFHLAKFGDEWKIVNVLWQSPPPKAH